MAKLDSLPPNKNNFDYDDEVDEPVDYRNNYLNTLFQFNFSTDYLKIITIILLLVSSILLHNYEPSPIIRRVNNTEILNNRPHMKEIDDNPYNFHPFYQVHKRIQYKNPTINPCRGMIPSKTLLLAILSRASNVHIREAIRQTWGAVRIYNDIEIRMTFIVGVDDGMIKQIEIEQKIYHDIIQINLPENYPVVSYKELAALCWSRYFCSDIQYIFKADEDIHLNTPLLTRIVAELMKNETLVKTPIMFGWFRQKSRVDRIGRYLITEEEYPGFYYPSYTFGIGYMLTRAGRDNLCISSQRPHPVTRVGDAYITGILRDHAQVDYRRFGDVHYIYSYTLNGPLCQSYFVYDPKLLVCMSSVHSGNNEAADEYITVWNGVYKDVDDDDHADKE